MNTPAKILYITHEGDDMKGSTYSLLNMINAVSAHITPIVIAPIDGKACNEFRARGIECHVIPFEVSFTNKRGLKKMLTIVPRYFRDKVNNDKACKKIIELIKNRGIDIIHSNSAAVDVGIAVAKKLNIKHVWHLREFLDLDFNLTPVAGWRSFFNKINSSDAVICITNKIYTHYHLTTNKKAYVLFDAVRKQDEASIIKHKLNYFLFCGFVTPAKGVEDALKAFAIVNKKQPQLKLKIAGSIRDGYLPQLNKLITELQIDDNVELMGFQNNVDNLMAEALGLLMCSKNEAQGRVTIEAMFKGCPVIGYASGGTLEIIKNNETGFLYTEIDDLANKMMHLITDQKNLEQIIAQAQSFAIENFSEERFASKLTNIYNNLI